MLQVNNLTVSFDSALAINDFSLDVRKGEIVGVLGSNSAGKTTLMNSISGLILDMKLMEDRVDGIRIDVTGEILFQDENLTRAYTSERVKRGIVLARERHPIFPTSSVMENLKIAGYLRKTSEIRNTMEYVMEVFPPLQRLKARRAGLLSGGEQQMLMIGMVLVAEPRLMLLDEPLLGLSPLLQQELMRAIKTIREQRGVTILVTEQFARPLLPVIDRGYVIENGTLVMTGAKQELMDNPEVMAAYFGV
ncbi:ABC transporter ATP-binding protein [Thermodesulfobacteriota bacterium]